MTVFLSKLTTKAQTVIPQALRLKLDLKPGDIVRYRETEAGVVIDKLPARDDEETLAAFSEWSSAADDRAFGGL